MTRVLSAVPHLEAMRDIVGAQYVLEERDPTSPYLKDWTGEYVSTPLCVVLPGSTRDVSQIMSYCHAQGLAVVPQGGHTGLVGGSHTADASRGVLLSLKRMNAVRELDAANDTAEVEAGCIVQDVQDLAAEAGRSFPLAFGAQGSAQIGGAVSTNAGGLNVLRYGMTRDLVLGLEVVLADGTVVDTLSKLRKDNRGLDLKQLFIGTEGTLGVITAVSVKLFPGVQSRETALLALEDLQGVVALYNMARSYCADLLTAFELIPRACIELALEHQSALRDPLEVPHEIYVLLELTCSGPLDLRALTEGFLDAAMSEGLVVDGTMAESLTQSKDLWAIREAMVEAQPTYGRHLRTDISVPITSLPDFILEAQATLSKLHPSWSVMSYGHIGDGNIHLNALPPKGLDDAVVRGAISEMLGALYPIVDTYDGSISAEHGIGRSRRAAYEARLAPAERDIAQAIKHVLDPHSLLNPGCLLTETRTGATSK